MSRGACRVGARWRTLGVILVSLMVGTACASFKKDEPLLFPAGLPTADALRNGEWMIAPPPWGWMAYGLTDRLTVGWDYPVALLGYPAGLVRYQFPFGTPNMRFAGEFYFLGFPKELVDDRSPGYQLVHRGTQSWFHLQHTSRLSEKWRWHIYAGSTYATYQHYLPNKEAQFEPVLYEKHSSPDWGTGIQWDARPGMKVHVNYSFGNTLYFVDQVALKHLFVYTLHFAPFSESKPAILRNLRFDLSSITSNVPVAQYQVSLPLPVYPTVYWQWGGQ